MLVSKTRPNQADLPNEVHKQTSEERHTGLLSRRWNLSNSLSGSWACPVSSHGSIGLFNLCIFDKYHTVPYVILHHWPGVFYGKCGTKLWGQDPSPTNSNLARVEPVNYLGETIPRFFFFFSKDILFPWQGWFWWVAGHLCVHWNLISFPAVGVM